LRGFLRWARKNAPSLIPMILGDALLGLVCTPTPAVWRRYAARCRTLATSDSRTRIERNSNK
jgi:hypothetical protein